MNRIKAAIVALGILATAGARPAMAVESGRARANDE